MEEAGFPKVYQPTTVIIIIIIFIVSLLYYALDSLMYFSNPSSINQEYFCLFFFIRESILHGLYQSASK